MPIPLERVTGRAGSVPLWLIPNCKRFGPRHDLKGLRFAVPQNPRRRRRRRFKLRYFRVVFRREIQQPLLGEGVGVFGEPTAALCLFF
jgi:hypothetical protein